VHLSSGGPRHLAARRRRTTAAWALLTTMILAVTACGGSNGTTPSATGRASRRRASTTTTTSTTTVAPTQVVVRRTAATLPRGSARAVLVADGDHLLLLGGLDGAKNTTAEILRIDPAAGTVTNAGELAVAVHDGAGALVAGRPTVFGGGNASESSAVQAVQGDGQTRQIGQLPVPRSDLAATAVDGRVFLLGGYDGARVRATTIATTDGAAFQILGDLPTPVRYAAVAPLGREVFAIGGTTTGNAGGAVRAVQALDTVTGAVRPVGYLPFALTDAVAAELGGHVYVMGGLVNGAPSDQVWRLDPPTPDGPLALVPVATLPVPLADAAVAVDHGVAYLAGGESPALSSAIFSVEVR